MKTCDDCGRLIALDSMYWYALGRLHGLTLTEENLRTVFGMRPVAEYCWSYITGHYDGPSGPEYSLGHRDCVEARGHATKIEETWEEADVRDV